MDLNVASGFDGLTQFALGLLAGGVGMRLVLRSFSHQEPKRPSRSIGGARGGQSAQLRDTRSEFARLLSAVSSQATKRK